LISALIYVFVKEKKRGEMFLKCAQARKSACKELNFDCGYNSPGHSRPESFH
jgi:hypothetical protein